MKKKVTDKTEKSKKKQRVQEEAPKEKEEGSKWQEFLHRHKVKQEKNK